MKTKIKLMFNSNVGELKTKKISTSKDVLICYELEGQKTFGVQHNICSLTLHETFGSCWILDNQAEIFYSTSVVEIFPHGPTRWIDQNNVHEAGASSRVINNGTTGRISIFH